jgi:exopolysaccharide biosynthesis WecB/TagA/CpsF family protein/anti-anti-sigma factor
MPANPPATTPARAPIAILGVPFDNVTTADALGIIGEMVASRQPHYAAAVGVDFLVQALEDVELRRILFDAHLVLGADKQILWAARMLGNPLPERVGIHLLLPPLLALAAQKNWRIFLLGDTEPGLAAAVENVRAQNAGLIIAGAFAPPAGPLLEMNHADILHRVHAVKPDVLLVAFGSAKQEKWINMNFREAGVPFTLGVGAAFQFPAATGKRPPEPPSPGGKNLWLFTRLVLRQRWELRARKTKAAAGPASVVSDPFGNFVMRAPARLGAAEAQTFGPEWRRAVENGQVMFDLSDTIFSDSTGLGMLIQLRRRARELDHQFYLIAPRPAVEAALRLMKLEDFFTVQASLSGARILMESAAHAPMVTSGVLEKELQIRWTGEVTALNAVELGAYTEAELSQTSPGMKVVIDLARVTFVDSTGIGLMLRFKKNLKRRDIALQFTNVADSVRNAIRHTRLEEYLLGDK